MPRQEHIDVRVCIDGLPLQEYEDPSDESDEPNLQTRFIEVKAGQKFEVRVKWTPGFNIGHASHLCSRIATDGKIEGQRSCTKSSIVNHHTNIVINEKIMLFDSCYLLDDATHASRRGVYTFGALGISDDDDKKNMISPKAASELGEIQRDENVTKVHEEALKGRQLKNVVQYEPEDVLAPPPIRRVAYVPVNGHFGAMYRFKFLYRSHKILQSIGRIPRSPSPPPDRALMLERTEDMLRIAKQNERQANLRLLRLQEEMRRYQPKGHYGGIVDLYAAPSDSATNRAAGIKQEDNDQWTAITTVDSEGGLDDTLLGSTARTKRERCEDEDELVELAPPPPQKPRLVVDLTEDD